MRLITDTLAVGAISRRHRRHRALRVLAIAARAATVLSASPARAGASTPVFYSGTYSKLLAAFPSGYADSCDITAALTNGGRICDARVDLVYFYPDGTLGRMPWYVDASSLAGWSIQRDPCDGLTGEQYELWAAYVAYVNRYYESSPNLTAEQIDRFGALGLVVLMTRRRG